MKAVSNGELSDLSILILYSTFLVELLVAKIKITKRQKVANKTL